MIQELDSKGVNLENKYMTVRTRPIKSRSSKRWSEWSGIFDMCEYTIEDVKAYVNREFPKSTYQTKQFGIFIHPRPYKQYFKITPIIVER